METIKECWTNSGSINPLNSICMVTYLPSSQTFQVRWARHVGHCWRRKDKLVLSSSIHGPTSDGQQAKTYIHQLFVDTGCRLENLPKLIREEDTWWERIKGIHEELMRMMMMMMIMNCKAEMMRQSLLQSIYNESRTFYFLYNFSQGRYNLPSRPRPHVSYIK